MELYQGKKVVIIGGTSGMGLATAKMLLDGGARVVVTGRSKAGLESAQKELGKGAVVVSSDARSLTEIDALASRVKADFDTFDLLFVNAGFSTRAPLESLTEAIYDEQPERQGTAFQALSSSRPRSPTSRECPVRSLMERPRLHCVHSPGRSLPTWLLTRSASTR